MSNVVRLISASKSDFETMTPMDLKESIYKSEGRVIMGQHLLFAGAGLVRGVTNSELMFAFGSDMVLLNTIDLDNWDNNPGAASAPSACIWAAPRPAARTAARRRCTAAKACCAPRNMCRSA